MCVCASERARESEMHRKYEIKVTACECQQKVRVRVCEPSVSPLLCFRFKLLRPRCEKAARIANRHNHGGEGDVGVFAEVCVWVRQKGGGTRNRSRKKDRYKHCKWDLMQWKVGVLIGQNAKKDPVTLINNYMNTQTCHTHTHGFTKISD